MSIHVFYVPGTNMIGSATWQNASINTFNSYDQYKRLTNIAVNGTNVYGDTWPEIQAITNTFLQKKWRHCNRVSDALLKNDTILTRDSEKISSGFISLRRDKQVERERNVFTRERSGRLHKRMKWATSQARRNGFGWRVAVAAFHLRIKLRWTKKRRLACPAIAFGDGGRLRSPFFLLFKNALMGLPSFHSGYPAFLQKKWRRERDSNPRRSFPLTTFPMWRLRPLNHLSDVLFNITLVFNNFNRKNEVF